MADTDQRASARQRLNQRFDLAVVGAGAAGLSVAYGAARLGWLAAGGDPAVVLAKPPVRDEFIPNAERHVVLRQRLKGFRELYQHVRPLFDPARPRLA